MTAAASIAGVQLGAPIQRGTLPPFTSTDLRFPVTVLPSVPPSSRVAFTVAVAGQDACQRNPISVALTTLIGVDEAAAVSRVDYVGTVAALIAGSCQGRVHRLLQRDVTLHDPSASLNGRGAVACVATAG